MLAQQRQGFEARPTQIRMASLVSQALAQKKNLLVEAGTGTGKTLAYLLPLLLSRQRAIVCTGSKALQDQIVRQEVPLLRQVVDFPFSAVVLKGRENYLCLHQLKNLQEKTPSLLEKEYRLFSRIKTWAQETLCGDREELSELPERSDFWANIHAGGDRCLGVQCPDIETCFLTRVRQRAFHADLVITNHHLFFADLAIREGGFGQILPERTVAVFDEAHKIPDIVTQFFGLELSNYQLRTLVSDGRRAFSEIGTDDPVALRALDALEQSAQSFRKAFPEGDTRSALTSDDLRQNPGVALTEIQKHLEQLVHLLTPHRPRSVPLASATRRAETLLNISEKIKSLNDPTQVYWYTTRGNGIFLQVSPLQTGPLLKKTLFQKLESAIFTSATLTMDSTQTLQGFSFFINQLGVPNENGQLLLESLPSPFDYHHQALLYLPTTIPEPKSPAFRHALLHEIQQILEVSSGRAFCLFTSYRMLHFIQNALSKTSSHTLLVQGTRPKATLIETFKRDKNSVLLATNAFWEGVDVPGEALSVVIIDKLPFVSPSDPLLAARSRWCAQQGDNPFQTLQMPRAILSLKQGLGRLLRSYRDRGLMAVLDARLRTRGYGKQFLSALPPAPVTDEIEEVRRFFEVS